MAEQETFLDRLLFFRAFGFWPGEAPREPDDLHDLRRDRSDLSDSEWQRLHMVYGVYSGRRNQ